jgi:hypothetical protein
MRNPTWDRAVLDAHRLVARAQKCRAYQFADGFDDYNSAASVYEYVGGTPVYGSAYRRFAPPAGLPGQGVYLPPGASLRKTMASNQSTFINKIAYAPQALPSAFGTCISAVADGTAGGTIQVALVWDASGALHLYRAWASPYVSGSLFSTGPGIIAPGNFYSIEVAFNVNSSSGGAQVWVNGFEVMNATGLNTQFTSNAFANIVWITDSANPGCYVDDFRVWDNTGSTQNAALGTDSRLVTKLPSGAGIYTQWTPNGAAANWQCVDDNPPDGDTTYVSGSTASLTDAYATPIAGFTAPPAMVVAIAWVRKDDSATRTMQLGVAQSGGSSVVSGGTFTLGSTYVRISCCLPDDPATSAPWTAAGADTAQHYKQETA